MPVEIIKEDIPGNDDGMLHQVSGNGHYSPFCRVVGARGRGGMSCGDRGRKRIDCVGWAEESPPETRQLRTSTEDNNLKEFTTEREIEVCLSSGSELDYAETMWICDVPFACPGPFM